MYELHREVLCMMGDRRGEAPEGCAALETTGDGQRGRCQPTEVGVVWLSHRLTRRALWVRHVIGMVPIEAGSGAAGSEAEDGVVGGEVAGVDAVEQVGQVARPGVDGFGSQLLGRPPALGADAL